MMSLIDPTMLFRFSVPCLKVSKPWGATGVSLTPRYALPSLQELSGREAYADVRIGWNNKGIFVQAEVTGKEQALWCRDSRVEDSDGLHLFIDTRDTHTIHRANRFCHWFTFMPEGTGARRTDPLAAHLEINRARENPTLVRGDRLSVYAQTKKNGYLIRGFIPADCLTGFDPSDYPRLGFSYAVVDRELGWQTFTVGPEYPIQEDPTLWSSLELEG